MTTRDELADLILDTVDVDVAWGSPTVNVAPAVDAILARWRLVPVAPTTLDQERDKWASAYFGVDIAAQRRAADELTQHDQTAGHYDDGCKPCTDLRTAMLDLHQCGFSDRQIAERLGMSTRTIANRRRKMGLQYNDGKAIRTDQHGPHEG